MKKVLHLLSSGRVLGVMLFLSVCVTVDVAGQEDSTTFSSDSIRTSSNVSETTNLTDVTTASQVPRRDYTSTLHDVAITSTPTARRTSPEAFTTTTTTIAAAITATTATTTNTLTELLANKACAPLLMLSFGLFLACFIFMMSTLLLTCRVCQLNRQIKTLSKNDELISNSDFWMGTAKRNKSKSETEAKETSVLLADIQQIQEEMNGAVKEDGEKVNKDGQMEEEKKVGDASLSNEALAENKTTANSSSSKTEEKVADSESTNAEAASPPKGTEETQSGP